LRLVTPDSPMHLRKTVLLVGGLALLQATLACPALADDTSVAATAVNALGVDLLACVAKPNENALLSPYSIQSALAMTYAGAAGETKAEMAKVIAGWANAFAALATAVAT